MAGAGCRVFGNLDIDLLPDPFSGRGQDLPEIGRTTKPAATRAQSVRQQEGPRGPFRDMRGPGTWSRHPPYWPKWQRWSVDDSVVIRHPRIGEVLAGLCHWLEEGGHDA